MFEKYRVSSNDTLASIADKFNTEVRILKDINNLFFDEVREGMELIVPDNAKEYFSYYTINEGDTLYQIARRYNINPTLLASMNGIDMNDYIYPNQKILIPKSGYAYYVTAEGDTLEMVAKTFKTSKEKVINENKTIYLLGGQLLVNKKN